MALLPILEYPDPRLRIRAEPVTKFDAEVRQLVADMFQTMYAAPGIGLAAIQVGMDKPEAGEWNQVDPVIQPEVIFPDAGKGDLEQIPRRADLHHGAERKISIGIIVEIESEREGGPIDCAGRESEVRSEAPPVFICTRRHRSDNGPEQDRQCEHPDRGARTHVCRHGRTIA